MAEKAWSGDVVVIAKAGKPYLDLIPHKVIAEPRNPGSYKGKIKISKDFDQISADIIDEFEGNT